MQTVLGIGQVLIAIAMVAVILVQRGAGAAAGSGFGAGASGTVFGSQGSGNFLSRTTAVLATSFFLISFILAMLASRTVDPTVEPDLGVMSGAATEVSEPQDAPTPEELGLSPVPGDVVDTPAIDVPAAQDVPVPVETTATEEQVQDSPEEEGDQ